MFLIALENGEPVGNPITLDNFKLLNAGMSLPFPLLPEHIEPHGYGIYDFSMPPECGTFEKIEEIAPAKSPDNGVYYQTRIAVPMSEEEIEARTAQEWAAVRFERNRRLAACDWWVTKAAETNATISVEQHTYRQALRDITNQADPFNIIWPIQPVA